MGTLEQVALDIETTGFDVTVEVTNDVDLFSDSAETVMAFEDGQTTELVTHNAADACVDAARGAVLLEIGFQREIVDADDTRHVAPHSSLKRYTMEYRGARETTAGSRFRMSELQTRRSRMLGVSRTMTVRCTERVGL
ncbi:MULTISPECIES: hypothetical protein [Haloarcula]|uniref:hypothetical protein n=1 Tax=Haloarcula TaxID=2237 RepID=UPI0023EC6F99|nr:hypothetical protein [Halomicroarcula sp. XH51]